MADRGSGGTTESIHNAARRGDAEQVAKLIDSNPELLELRDERGWCPIHAASECGHTAVVRLLTELGADINEPTDEGLYLTPLHLAAGNGSAELVLFLISTGAQLDHRDDNEITPIHDAALFGRPQALQALLQSGANPRDRVEGQTPLSRAEANLNAPHLRPRFSEHVPSATEDEYRAVVDILRKHPGVIEFSEYR